jgi:protein TonB
MVAHEVRLKVSGMPPASAAGERQLFTEETTSLLVFETGGVIRLSAAVVPGQLLLLSNQDSLREAIVQVKRKRVDRPTSCFVELEFTEPSPRFWGTEFSAATALLPKNSRDVEAAALIVSAENTADDPGEAPAPPTAEEIQALKREVEASRGLSKSSQLSSPTEITPAPAPATVPDAPPAPFSTAPIPDSISNTNQNTMDILATQALPFEQIQAAVRCPTSEEVPRSNPALDYTIPARMPKRSRRARGNFTPAFVAGISRLAILMAALLVTIVGAAWYKHWLPWQAAAKKPNVGVRSNGSNAKSSSGSGSSSVAESHSESGTTNVVSDAPVTTAGRTLPAASARNTSAPEETAASKSAASPVSPRKPETRPDTRRTVTVAAAAKKQPANLSAVKPVSSVVATPAADNTLVPPKLIKSVRAVATMDQIRDFETGNVVIDAVVGTSGEVNFVSVLSGPPSLRGPAVEALKEYRYEPATRNGQPVPAHVTITIHFRFEP